MYSFNKEGTTLPPSYNAKFLRASRCATPHTLVTLIPEWLGLLTGYFSNLIFKRVTFFWAPTCPVQLLLQMHSPLMQSFSPWDQHQNAAHCFRTRHIWQRLADAFDGRGRAAGGRGVQNTTAPALWRMNTTSTKKTTNCDKRVKEKDRKTWVIKKEGWLGGEILLYWQVITELKMKRKRS